MIHASPRSRLFMTDLLYLGYNSHGDLAQVSSSLSVSLVYCLCLSVCLCMFLSRYLCLRVYLLVLRLETLLFVCV